MNNELNIPIRLDRTKVQADAAAFKADMSRLAHDVADDAGKAADSDVASFRAAAKKKKEAAFDAAKHMTYALAGEVQPASSRLRQSFVSLGETMKSAATAGVTGFGNITSSFAVQTVSLQKLIELAGAYGRAVTEAGEKAKKMAEDFNRRRDDLSELATLMGQPADSAFTEKVADFGVRTRMRPDEAKGFLTELYNSGAQFKGKKISEKEFDQFGEQAASLGNALGFDPAQVGNMAGTVLGFTDYTKFGDMASEEATAKMNSALQILGHGKGRQSVLMNQYSMLTSAALNDDEMKGSFTDADEAAMAISIGAEKHDASAAEMIMQSKRWLGGFDKKQKGLLEKAKIGPQDRNFIKNLEKLGPAVLAEAQSQNKTVEQVLRENSEDQGSAEALAVLLNKGVFEGGFDERKQFGKGVQGVDKAFDTIDKFKDSDRGTERLRETQIELAKTRQGRKGSRVETLRKEVIAAMVNSGELDSADSLLKDYLAGTATFGALGDTKQNRIDQGVEARLRSRFPAGQRPGAAMVPTDPAARIDFFNKMMGDIEGTGVNPLTGQAVAEKQGRPRVFNRSKPVLSPDAPDAPAGANGAGAAGGKANAGGDSGDVLGVLRSIARKLTQPSTPPRPLVERPAAMTR